MAGANLLALLDDIATILDDISVMSKVAAQKTAGVLGDDLALNAEQVSGVSADRELPVVWAVAKGSLRNKAILVPSALLISFFLPWIVTPLLMLGGAYLCFEGAEKIAHKILHRKSTEDHHQADLKAVIDPAINLVDYEKDKIKGAIRTDFILSAEIITITLGIVADSQLVTQIVVLSMMALVMTVGVYGLVAVLVKMDDVGLHFYRKSDSGSLKKKIGLALMSFAPKMMKALAVAGTVAMFLVGGGILVHGIPAIHHTFEHWQDVLAHGSMMFSWSSPLLIPLLNGFFGLVSGLLLVEGFQLMSKRRPTTKASQSE